MKGRGKMKEGIRETMKRWVCLILAVACVLNGLPYTPMIARADEGGGAGLPAFRMTFGQVGGAANQVSTGVYMLKNAGQATYNLSLNPGYTSGGAQDITVTLASPYLVYDAEGNLTTTFEAPEDYTAAGRSVRTTIVDVPNGNWYVEGTESTVLYTAAGEIMPYPEGKTSWKGEALVLPLVDSVTFTGMVEIKIISTAWQGPNAAAIQLGSKFYGDVPENASASVDAGLSYRTYKDAAGNIINGLQVIKLGGNPNIDNGDYNSIAFINSNLDWSAAINAITHPPMWDQYNYMTYRVTVENISAKPESFLDGFDLNLSLMNGNDGSSGILRKDMMAWKCNDDGTLTKNTDLSIEATQYAYSGKPGEGGVLIWDVTDVPEAELSEWNLDDFSNINAPLIPYYYPMEATLNIKFTDMPLYSPHDPNPARHAQRVFYIAVPYPNNFGGNLFNATTLRPTIFFGKTADRVTGYSWSKEYRDTTAFDKTVINVTQNKYVLNDAGNQVKTIESGIGQLASYYLDSFENKGNVPIFDSYALDTIPNHFQLEYIKIYLEDGMELEDWFRAAKDGPLLEMEVQAGDGTLSWVSCGTLGGAQTEADGGTSYTITLGEEMEQWLAGNKGKSFTRRIRLNFMHRIRSGLKFKGKVEVAGYPLQAVSYVNNVQTNYQQWTYYDSLIEYDGAGGYKKRDLNSTASKATINAKPTNPAVAASGLRYEDGAVVESAKTVQVPMNEEKGAYRYLLTNNSPSKMSPAIFYTDGNFLGRDSHNQWGGFRAREVRLSAGLLQQSKIASIVFTDASGGTWSIPGGSLNGYIQDGDVVLGYDVWKNHTPDLQKIQVLFDGFESDVTAAEDCRIEIKGSPNMAEQRTVAGVWRTDYDPELGVSNRQGRDSATLTVKAINPQISGTTYYKAEDGTAKTGNVPYRAEDAWYSFTVENRSPSAAEDTNLEFSINSLSQKTTGIRGFKTKEIVIEKGWDQVVTPMVVWLYDWDQDPHGTGAPKVSLKWEDVEARYMDADGRVKIPLSDFPELTELKQVRLVCTHLFADVYAKGQNPEDPAQDNALRVELHGTPDWHKTLQATGALLPQNYLYSDFGKTQNVNMNVAEFAPKVTASTHLIRNGVQQNGGSDTPHTLASENNREVWYGFRMANSSISPSGPAYSDINLSSVVNRSSTGTSVHGFKSKEIVISAQAVQACKIEDLELYDYADMNGTVLGTPSEVVTASVLKGYQQADGSIRIPLADFPGIAYLRYIRIHYEDFYGSGKAAGSSLQLDLYGDTDWFGNLDASANLVQDDEDYTDNKSASDWARFAVAEFAPVVTASTHFIKDGQQQNGGSSSPHTLTVANNQNVWYGFRMANNSISPSGPSYADINISSAVNRSSAGTAVHGFKSEEIVISAQTAQACEIKDLELYDYADMNGANPGTPSRVFTAKELEGYKQADGSIHIPMEDIAEISYLRYIRIHFTDFYGSGDAAGSSLQLDLYGNTDWFDNLDAVGKLVQDVPDYTANKSASDTARFNIQRPYLALHSHIQYVDVTESSRGAGTTDGNQTLLGVPYDRDFKLWVQMENGSSPAASGYSVFSVLDDVDLTVDLPIRDSAGVRFTDKSGAGAAEAHTGFHTTKTVVRRELLDQYRTIGSIQLADVDSPDSPAVLTPVTGAGGKITGFDAADGTHFNVTDEGLVLEESQLEGLGIQYLARLQVLGGRDMKVTGNADRAALRVEFYGYEDSAIGTTDTMNVHSENYLDGLREDAYRVSANDNTAIYMSKMYFDTVVSAFYNDGDAGKFTAEADALEHIRVNYAGGGSYWNDNSELELGYKALGSFGIDFRQYLNVGTNLPVPAPDHGNYYRQEHYDAGWVRLQSLNTAATVNMSINVPSHIFDTYYLKINPNTRSYLNWIEVTRKDGTKYQVLPDDWVRNAVETGAAGNKYFRINLAKGQAPDYGADKEEFWTDAYAYDLDGPENPITKIVINMDVNQDGFTDASKTAAGVPDYGTWYRENDANTRSAFEVTGRLYKTGKAELTANTTLTIGKSGRVKERTDSGQENGRRVQSSWSYWNNYRSYSWNGYHAGDYESTARDMKSTAVMSVIRDDVWVRKGVHSATETEYDDSNVKFADADQFVISFRRGPRYTGNLTTGLNHDYSQTGNWGGWCYQDGYNWGGRIGFSDRILLTDTLPVIEPNSEFKYYGFLTTGLVIQNEVFAHMTSITLNLGGYREITDAEGNVTGYQADASKTKSITLTKEELGTLNELSFLYESEEQTEDEAAAVNQIWLEKWQFVNSIAIDTKDWGGNADYTKETGRTRSPETGGGVKDIDVVVKGKPYVYVNQPATGLGDSIRHAQNRITPTDYFVYDPNTAHTSPQHNTERYYVSDSSAPNHGWSDTFETAHMRGYLIPYQAGYAVTPRTSKLNDYQADNLTPNVQEYTVKIWNRRDGSTERDASSRLDGAYTTNTMNASFNMQKLYIPKEFIDGGWFRVSRLLLTGASNQQASFTLDELKALLEPDANGKDYVLDVEKYIHDNPGMTTGYSITLPEGTARPYLRAHINSFRLEFKAVAGNREKPETVLQAGEYLSASKTALDYAFRYDGVFVDRTKEVFEGENYRDWDEDSTPTFGKSPNGYGVDVLITNNLATTFTTIDPNHGTFSELNGTVKKADSYLSNLVGNLLVSVTRNSDTNKFAYDLDDCSAAAPRTEIDKDHLMPWDYVEYKVTVQSDASAPIPQEKTDLRFDTATGQRIVKWEVISNTTDIPADQITANLPGTGGAELTKGTDYSRDEAAADDAALTDIKQVVFHLGTEGDAAQIKQGKAVTLRIVTQLTDEFGKNFQGQLMTSWLYTTSRIKHGYTQYRINYGRENISGAGRGTVNYYRNESDNGTTSGNSNTDVSYWRNTVSNVVLDGRSQYASRIDAGALFTRLRSDLAISFAFAPEAQGVYDGQPGKVTVQGIKNYTQHTQEIQETASFLKKVGDRYLQGFELTELCSIDYPAGLAENAISPRLPVKIEYYVLNESSTAKPDGYDPNAYNNMSRTEEDINNGQWVNAADYKDNPEELEAMLSRVIRVRWTYYDVPAGQAMDKVVFNGVGRYQDERLGNKNTAAADTFTSLLTMDEVYTHVHTEEEHLGEVKKTVMNHAVQTAPSIRREIPVVQFQTQVFGTEEEASGEYNPSKAQKTGYRPNETFWYKSTLINLSTAASGEAVQGALLNPVFYDKFPSQYADQTALEAAAGGDMSGLHIVWTDANGQVKNADADWEVTNLGTVTAPDYGGAMVYMDHASTGYGGSGYGGKEYRDLDPRAAGVSKEAEYTVYRICPVSGADGKLRMEVGDQISFYYSATAHQDGLPMVMTDQDRNLGTAADQSPSYFPRVGEYWSQGYTGQAWPLATGNNSGGMINRQLETADKLMDMDHLIHDVGFSGDKNDQIDRYEMFGRSKLYIPGTANNGSAWGNDGRFMDYDIATGSYVQRAVYTPILGSGNIDGLPVQIQYRGADNANRDYYAYVTGPRTASSQNWEQAGEGEERTPIVWSEVRTHLQKAWLNAASQMIPDLANENGYSQFNVHDAAKRYLAGKHYPNDWPRSGSWESYIRSANDYLFNRYITMMEYQQTYTARLTASNYGDWSLDGVEFTYTFPLGTEPLRDADGNLQIAGKYLTAPNTWGADIPADAIHAELVQTPENDKGYRAPNQVQDPQWNGTMDTSYYQGEDTVPYVVKIAVSHPLKRWFGRGSGSGYQMRLDIKCHVQSTSTNGRWYDRLRVKPAITGENYYYYQIYDISQWCGANRYKDAHYQIHGMDYMSSWSSSGYYNYVNPTGSPNTPSVDGYNVQCSEAQETADGSDGVNTNKTYGAYRTGAKADLCAVTGTRAEMRKPVMRLWSTVSDTADTDMTGRSRAGYYVDTEGDTARINVNVENRYWIHEYSDGGYYGLSSSLHSNSYSINGGSMGTLYHPVISVLLPAGIVPMAADGKAYTEDNASNAVRPIAWELNKRANPQVNTISPADEAEKQLYDAAVQYVEIPEYEDGEATGKTEGRYLVRIEANLNSHGDLAQKNLEARILSGDLRIFSFKVFAEELPNLSVKGTDGQTKRDTTKYRQYEDIRTYLGSKMDGFSYLWDNGGRYRVGTYLELSGSSNYQMNDVLRLDRVANYLEGDLNADPTYGRRAFFDSGWAYEETSEFNVEHYAANIRNPLILTEEQKDFNASGANTHPDTGDKTLQVSDKGLYNRTRLYTKMPRVTSDSTVGFTKNEAGMGYSINSSTKLPNTYPDANTPLEYGDVLWYTSRIWNHPASASDYRYGGALHHSKLTFVFDLPREVTFWDEDDTYDKDDIIVEYYDARKGGDPVTVSMEELLAEESGWNLDIRHKTDYHELDNPSGLPEYMNTDKEKHHEAESVVVELNTPADENYHGYDSMYDGAMPGGHLSTGSWVRVRIKTRVDNLGEESSVYTEPDLWSAEDCQTYVTVHEMDGHFNEDSDQLQDQPQDLILWMSQAKDAEAEPGEGAEDSKDAVDHDRDGDYADVYTAARTAAFKLRKPDGVARVDTGIKRTSILDEDEQVVTATDIHTKGATQIQYLIDQAQNKGGAVNRFIVDFALPFHATNEPTGEIAPVTGSEVTPRIREIRTGVWEVPDTLAEEEKEVLEQQLKVYVFARTSPDPHAEDGYLYPDSQEDRAAYDDGSWIQLGKQEGYSLTENGTIRDSRDGIPANIRQVRFVVKAGLNYADNVAPVYHPVPSGFRLAVDADPDTDGSQEMDDVDPMRLNVEEVAEDVKRNCAYVQAATSSGDPTVVIHSNYFVQCLTRYDDLKYLEMGKRARAGIYVDPELPYFGFRMEMSYFGGSGITSYHWRKNEGGLIIDPSTSKMMKYRVTAVNYSVEQLDQKKYTWPVRTETDSEGNIVQKEIKEEDTLTDPNISVVVPYIQNLKDLTYVPYSSLLGDDPDYLSDTYSKTGGSPQNPLKNLDDAVPHWTWTLVQDKIDPDTGELILDEEGQPIPELVDSDDIEVELSEDPYFVDKVVNLATGRQRRIALFKFKGRLWPGQRLMIEFMMPINADRGAAVSQELMESYGYGFKKGNYTPYIPTAEDGFGSCGLVTDSRDVNDNGMTVEMSLRRTISGLSFKEEPTLKQIKKVDSQIHSDYDYNSGPASVPEGTDYTFHVSVMNQSTGDPKEHSEVSLYDVLPHLGDSQTYSGDTANNQIPRDSSWNGWLLPDSIEVRVYDPNKSTEFPEGELLEMTKDAAHPKDYDIWVGPFEQTGNTYKPLDVSALPPYKADESQGMEFGTKDMYFYGVLIGDDARKKSRKMVRLTDLIAATKNNPDAYEAAIKAIRSIWMEMEDKSYYIKDYNRIEMSYSMHAPLNVPKYVGDVSGDASTQFIDSKGYCGWNTFVHHAVGAGMTGENSKAGVYLNAPEGRGYIGSYIWHDFNYDTLMNEAEYEEGTNGRLQVSKLTTDLDFDGIPDDPGINHVKVELLSENGYVVNRNGEAITEVKRDGEGVKYALIDEATGEIQTTGENQINRYTDCGPAAAYISESDYFGHKGYYMLSDLKPGRYRLRFTFPESLANYAVTTLDIGDTKTKLDIYRKGDTLPDLGNEGVGDAPGDAMAVTSLVAQTRDVIQVNAADMDDTTVGADGLTPHQRYDLAMTSYNVGIGRPHTIGGWAWFDEHMDPDSGEDTPDIDGFMDDSEDKLGKVRVTLYEYDPDTEELKEANDIDGKPASILTEITDVSDLASAENGKFAFRVRPGWYLVKAENEDDAVILKPTPYKHNDSALAAENDNDLEKVGLSMQTKPFEVQYELGEDGRPLYDALGQGYKHKMQLGLGFVDAGRGFLGDTIWSDGNYNGIQEGLEPGIGGVAVTVERYYWDNEAMQWKQQEERFTSQKTTTDAGNFVFQEKTTYTPDGGPACLAGYRLRIDKDVLEGLPAHYAVTKYQNRPDKELGEELDSDMLTEAKDTPDGKKAYYLTDIDMMPIVLANEAQEGADPKNLMPYGRKLYDVTDGGSRLIHDGGLKEFEKIQVKGIIWNDRDYDGIRKTEVDPDDPDDMAEPGIPGVTVVLERYIRDSGDFRKLDEREAVTDSTGHYTFNNVGTYYEDPDAGSWHVTYYRLKLKELPEGYRVTRYHQGKDTSVDSDLAVTDLYLTKGTAPVEKDYFAAASTSRQPHNEDYCLNEGKVKYDIVQGGGNIGGYDGGLKGPETGSLSGLIWKEKAYDGIHQEDEEGFPGLTLTIDQYYLDADGEWTKEQAGYAQAVTGDDGRYLFEGLPVHIEKEGKWYLAGYKMTLPRQEKITGYETTWYHKGQDNEIDSDAVGTMDLGEDYPLVDRDGTTEREFSVTAKEAAKGTNDDKGAYVFEYAGREYDILTGTNAHGPDVGLKELETTTMYGWVWNDKDYDGIRQSDKTVDVPIEGQTVYLDQYYLSKKGEWELSQAGYATTLTDENGRYEFADIPAMLEVGNVRRLTAYQVRMDAMNQGWTLTKYRQGKESLKWSDLRQEDPDAAAAREGVKAVQDGPGTGEPGETKPEEGKPDEMKVPLTLMEDEEFLPAADEVKRAHSSYCVMAPDGKIYDMLAAPETKASGNAGELPYATGSISGWVWEDKNYDGIQDPDEKPVTEALTVKLERFIYENGNWVKDDGFAGKEARTDAVTGGYRFDKLPTHQDAYDEDGNIILGNFKIYGYQVRIDMDGCAADGLWDTYAVTKYRAGSNRAKDSDWIISDDADSGRLTAADEYIVVAAEAGKNANPVNVAEVEGISYDACQGTDIDGLDAGLKRYEDAALLGIAWKDANHDGILDEGEEKIEGLELVLTQAYYKDGRWTKAEDFRQEKKTGEDGTYKFGNLPASLNIDGTRCLAGYQLHVDGDGATLAKVLKQYAVSKYMVEDGSEKDNKLLWEGLHMSWPEEENSGWLVFAKEAAGGFSGNSYNYRQAGGRNYDLAYSEDIGSMNAGFSPYQTTSITGTAWTEDYDEKGEADGIRQETEKRQAGIKVFLDQYYLDKGKWKKADKWISFMSAQPEQEPEPEPEGRKAKRREAEADGNPGGNTGENPDGNPGGNTGENPDENPGGNTGENPDENPGGDAGEVPDDGLEDRPVSVPDKDGLVTAVTDENGVYRFDGLPTNGILKEAGGTERRVILGYKLRVPELPEGFDVTWHLAGDGVMDSDLDEATTEMTPEILVAPKTADPEETDENKLDGYSIVLAESYDGIDAGFMPYRGSLVEGIVWNDKDWDGLQGTEPGLEGHKVYLDVMIEGTDIEEGDTASGLALFADKEEEDPDKEPPEGSDGEDPDKKPSEGTEGAGTDENAPDRKAVKRTADTEAGTEPGTETENKNPSEGAGDKNPSTGEEDPDKKPDETPEEPEWISPVETDVPGEETDGILQDGVYRAYASCTTDAEGNYRFGDVPVLDRKTRRPYRYRLRMEKPSNAYYVPLNAGDDSVDNDYAHLNLAGYLTDQAQGITRSFRLGGAAEKENAYGYSYHMGYTTVQDMLDFGLHVLDTETVVAGSVFVDENKDGIRNGEEQGRKAVNVILYRYDAAAQMWKETPDADGKSRILTEEDGRYMFRVPVADMEKESKEYLTPYRYRVSIMKPKDDAAFSVKYPGRQATNAAALGAGLYDASEDYQALAEKVNDFNDATTMEGKEESGLPAAGPQLVISSEFELAEVHRDYYLGRDVVSLDQIHVDIGRGAALLEDGGEGITADMEVWPLPKNQPYVPGTEPLETETDDPVETVRTGDDTQIGKYILVLAVSGLMIGLLVFFKKRKKEDEES